MDRVDEALEQAYRQLFGRLVGWLFRRTGDLQLAEDAVADAFASAVVAWRGKGIPDSPEAWLRVAARNSAMSALRRAARSVPVAPEDLELIPEDDVQPRELDDRLGLMLVCTHPAIDERMHAPLMLQAVLGVDAARIASAFLVSPATMGQRLSRTKTKIRDAGIRFALPPREQLTPRLDAVLQAVYGAYGIGDTVGGDGDADLRAEALRLSTLLTELLPDQAETWGLLALILHTRSRRTARVAHGAFVPLAQQDTALWSKPDRERADAALRRAAALGQIGRFQLEAAISAIHSSRADGHDTDWDTIVVLYRGLLRIAPSVGATLGAAAALIEGGETTEAAALLDALAPEAVRDHQPYWICRAQLAQASNDDAAAHAAFDRAIGLTSDPALRRYLLSRR
ncbi:RNA polymerase sigma factor [Microbacterium sp. DT81.1]|uniref:RNA polymerase sigma factor n=1 Tax=Microbacterium sp. DT81.1 TaxID=3393413 RepID=UPI003CEA3964